MLMVDPPTIEEINPQLIHEIGDKKFGILGYLVIDSLIDGVSSGGVRMTPELTLKELIHLARNMTLKYGFLGFRTGGAKAGLFIEPSLPKEERTARVKAFGRGMAPLIRSGAYRPGLDMGASVEDIINVYEGAGIRKKAKKLKYRGGQAYTSHVYTSWTMLASVKEILKEIGISLSGLSVAIQGFGKVGGEVARVFSEEGAKVVGVSNKKGAIYNLKGLDVQELLEMRELDGEDVVRKLKSAKRIKKSDLFHLPVDILVPCAQPWAINSTNVDGIKAKVICPGANIPMTPEIEVNLSRRGIVVLPDFVANCGGVLGSGMKKLISEKKIRAIIEKEFSRKISNLIKLSKEKELSLREVAEEMAMTKFYNIKKVEESTLQNHLFKVSKKITPRFIKKIVAPKYFIHLLRS